jgi:hypothetical protein
VTLVAADPTIFDYVNLGIAVFAAVVAVAALSWQAVAWAAVRAAHRGHDEAGCARAGAGRRHLAPEARPNLQDLVQQGFNHAVIAAEIRNKGRMPVTVTGVTVLYSNGIQLKGMDPPAGERLPYRLDAHAEFTFLMSRQLVEYGLHATKATGGTRRARLAVSLSINLLGDKCPIGLAAASGSGSL